MPALQAWHFSPTWAVESASGDLVENTYALFCPEIILLHGEGPHFCFLLYLFSFSFVSLSKQVIYARLAFISHKRRLIFAIKAYNGIVTLTLTLPVEGKHFVVDIKWNIVNIVAMKTESIQKHVPLYYFLDHPINTIRDILFPTVILSLCRNSSCAHILSDVTIVSHMTMSVCNIYGCSASLHIVKLT